MATPAAAISRSIHNYTLLYIGHTSLSIIHTIRLAALYQMYGMFFTPCMVVFLHPMWYCPSGEIAVSLHPEKRTGHHNRCGLPLFRHTETQVYRCSAYHISWWLSTRWTWLISVKMYTTRLLPTTRRCRRHWISRTWCLSQSAPRMATTW